MELFCEKYKKKMAEAEAVCEHLEEYCKFRTACVINFITRERLRENRREVEAEPEAKPADSGK